MAFELRDKVTKERVTWSLPNFAEHRDGNEAEADEVETRDRNGLVQARCPCCSAWTSPHALALWVHHARGVCFACDGCRTAQTRDGLGAAKADILMALGAPDRIIQWTRVQAKIGKHPGGLTRRKTIEVDQVTGEMTVVEIEGGRTGVRSTIGVVD